jgi:hypothetical protein
MWSPHLETELELMANHLEQGDEVYVVACQEKLLTCLMNPNHLKSICLNCQGKFRVGVAMLGSNVHIVSYPLIPQNYYSEIPDTFGDINDLKNFKLGFLQLGLCSASSLITKINREHRLNTVQHSTDVSRELCTGYYVYICFQKILQKVKPDRVYIFNGRFSTTLPAINACEEAGVPFCTHDRGGRVDSYCVFEDTTPHDCEYATKEIYGMWSNIPEVDAIAQGSKFFEDRRARIEHSWVSFTKNQQKGVLPLDFDPHKRNFGIFNTTIEEYAAVRDWPNPILIYKDEIDAIERICHAFGEDPNAHFYLRMHPNLKGYDNSQTKEIYRLGKRTNNLTIIPPESNIDSYMLMNNCRTVITFGSTMGVEATYWGKPSILLGRSFYEKLNVAYVPKDEDEVISLLRQDLSSKPRVGAIQYGLWDLRRGTSFKRYLPMNLFKGEFLGKVVKPSIFVRICAMLYRLAEKKDMLAFGGTKIKRLNF